MPDDVAWISEDGDLDERGEFYFTGRPLDRGKARRAVLPGLGRGAAARASGGSSAGGHGGKSSHGTEPAEK